MVAAVGLIVLSPLLAAVAIAIRVALGAPVLFRQVRPGLHGAPFTILKFRTMRNLTDAGGQPRPDGERMTGLGKFLRSTSLDELPELWNVLKGDMSLVGPRPLLLEYRELYTETQARRQNVRPGITGWAQVNGRNAISWEQKFELDVWYVDHQSLWLDLRILAMTIERLFRRHGITQEGHASTEPFRGTP